MAAAVASSDEQMRKQSDCGKNVYPAAQTGQDEENKCVYPISRPFAHPFSYHTSKPVSLLSFHMSHHKHHNQSLAPKSLMDVLVKKNMLNKKHCSTKSLYNIDQRKHVPLETTIPLQCQNVDKKKTVSSPQRARDCVTSTVACVLCSMSLPPHDPSDTITIYHLARVPDISMDAYVQRLALHTRCSEMALITAVILVCRLFETGVASGNELTTHRVFLVALRVATKCYDDEYYNNRWFADTGGIERISDFNTLESEFLQDINYATYVSIEQYRQVCRHLGTLMHITPCTCMREEYIKSDIAKDMDDCIPQCEIDNDNVLFPRPARLPTSSAHGEHAVNFQQHTHAIRSNPTLPEIALNYLSSPRSQAQEHTASLAAAQTPLAVTKSVDTWTTPMLVDG
jgi:hypothetical protein